MERNRLEIFPLEFDMGDHTFPEDRLIELNIDWRYIEDEIAEVVKDWALVINLHAVHKRHAMHDDDVRPASISSCVHFLSQSAGANRSGNSSLSIAANGRFRNT